MKLSGRVALITGASRGIGRAVAVGFAKAGADLILCARTADALAETAKDVETVGRQVLAQPLDVANEAGVADLIASGMQRFGHIDVLYNNAGVLIGGKIWEIPLAVWRQHLDVHVTGTFLMCKHVVPHMIAQNYGRIINVTSGLSVACSPGVGAYNTAKGAVNSLTKTLAAEVRDYNILVNAQCPGSLKTAMNPGGARPPEAAVPTALYLATLPDGGPTGRFYRDLQELGWWGV